MEKNALISVIVPVYNTEVYLSRCLESILGSTYTNLEIICVNDGSTDDSLTVLQAFAEKDPRMIVIDKENGGVSSARNRGIAASSGKWISFVDSDDWIHPQFFEVLVELAEKTNCEVMIAEYSRTQEWQPSVEVDNKSCLAIEVKKKDLLHNRFIKNAVWGRIFSKKSIENLSFDEDVYFAEDILFNIGILYDKKTRVYSTSETLYYSFNRPGSAVNSVTGRELATSGAGFIKHALDEDDEQFRSVYLEESIKRFLSARYLGKYDYDRKELTMLCNKALKKGNQEFSKLKNISLKQRLLYASFYHFPFLYRFWRITNDPTLLDWEKNQRRKLTRR